MNLKFKIAAFLSFGLMSAPSFGGWTSAGGGLLKDANNPWFIKNVSDVTYCIKIDEAHFGRSEKDLQSIVAKAIDHWKGEFRSAFEDLYDLRIATQNFIERPCPDDMDSAQGIDVAFQFGWLTDTQRRFLGDPRKYVGIAVRTYYDEVLLKGKGFIYMSPQTGPDRFTGDEVANQPWSIGPGGNVYRVLLHELGHVFGIPHTHTGSTDYFDKNYPALMSADFAERIVNRKNAMHFGQSFDVPRFFSFLKSTFPEPDSVVCEVPWSSSGSCGGMDCVLRFFEVPAGSRCLRFGFYFESSIGGQIVRRMTVKASQGIQGDGLGGVTSEIGEITFREIPDGDFIEMVTIWVTQNQTVIPNPNGLQSIPGPNAMNYRRSGIYQATGSQERKPLIVNFKPNSSSLDVLVDEKIYMNFVGPLYQ